MNQEKIGKFIAKERKAKIKRTDKISPLIYSKV